MLLTRKWLWPSGEEADQNEARNLLLDPGIELFVGTDSHLIGGRWIFATVIAAHRPGLGGRFMYHREEMSPGDIKHLGQRLSEEAMRSLIVASEIKNELGRDAEVHLDLSNEKHKSSKFVKQLTTMVSSCGFKVQIKPQAWVSSSIADRSAR